MKKEHVNGLTLSQAIGGSLLEKAAQQRSPHTVADYTVCFSKFLVFARLDTPIYEITTE